MRIGHEMHKPISSGGDSGPFRQQGAAGLHTGQGGFVKEKGTIRGSYPTDEQVKLMSGIRNCSQIKTSRNIKSFRFSVQSTGAPTRVLDQGRIHMGEARRMFSNRRVVRLLGTRL